MLATVLALLAGVLTGGPAARAAGCAGAHASAASRGAATLARAVVCEINRVRARHGLRRLRVSPAIALAAQRHSESMARHNYFSHVTPGGATIADRLRRSGYLDTNGPWRVGEAIGWGTFGLGTPAAIVDAWMASPPHRHLLLEAGYRHVGVGAAAGIPVTGVRGPGGTYTADFGVKGRG
jgi:uncharacterized protein YkwD